MTIQFRAALAAVPFALAVSAVHAQGTPGLSNPGTGEAPRGISTATLPPNVSMMATPVIEDPSILEEIGREVLTEDAVRARFGTISRSADGTVTERPASDEIMRLIMGETAEDPAFQNGAIDDEEEARVVGPQDSRRQILNATNFPVTAVGLVYAVYGEEGYACSGALIGPATVLTAAHCIYSHEMGWPDDVLYAPAMLGEQTIPYGIWEWDTLTVVPAYITEYRGIYGEVVPYDLGIVTLAQPVGNELGWLGVQATEGMKGFVATLLSYPSDKPFGTLWESACDVTFNVANLLEFVHYCDTFAGSSGGNMYSYFPADNERLVMGVNVAEVPGPDGFNIAVRMNQPYLQWIIDLWR